MTKTHTRQLVARQSECLTSNLLVQITLQLKHHPTDREPDSPVVELSLTLTHTLLIALGVHTDIGADPLVEFVLHASQPSLNSLFRDLERRSRHTPVVVFHAQPEISPNHCRSPDRAACRYMRPAFGRLGLLSDLWCEPVEGWRGRGEAA